MDEWRSKVLKDIQYTCKLAAWVLSYHEARRPDKDKRTVSTEVVERLKQGAAALSIARRIMMTGGWIEDYWDLSACAGAGGDGIVSWKGATLVAKTASALIDDVSSPPKAIYEVVECLSLWPLAPPRSPPPKRLI